MVYAPYQLRSLCSYQAIVRILGYPSHHKKENQRAWNLGSVVLAAAKPYIRVYCLFLLHAFYGSSHKI